MIIHLDRADDGMNGGKCARIIDFCKLDIRRQIVYLPTKLNYSRHRTGFITIFRLLFRELCVRCANQIFIIMSFSTALLRCTLFFFVLPCLPIGSCFKMSIRLDFWQFVRVRSTHSKYTLAHTCTALRCRRNAIALKRNDGGSNKKKKKRSTVRILCEWM